MNLSSDPWIDAWDQTTGPTRVSLIQVFDHSDTLEALAHPNPLVNASIWRLILAVDKISDGDGAAWLRSHTDSFDLFNADAPFFQHPVLAAHQDNDALFRPVASLELDASNTAALPTLDTSPQPVADTVHALLCRIMFGPGGNQPMLRTGPLGPKAGPGKNTVCGPRPLAMWHANTIADTITANRVPGPAGQFFFTWPDGWKPGDERAAAGQVEAFTWPSNAVALRPANDGRIDSVARGMGVAFGETTDPHIVPHTLFRRDKDGVALPHKLSSRPTWIAMYAAWADPEPVGVLAQSRGHGHRLAVTGMHLYQARIDGIGHEVIDEPVIDPADLRTVLEHVDATRKRFYGAVAAGSRIVASDKNLVGRRLVDNDTFTRRLRETVGHAAAGRVSVDNACETIDNIVAASAARAVEPFAARHPHVPALSAGRAYPRKDTA